MRVAIVGAGGMGSFHARSLAAMPDVEIVAVADIRLAAAQAVVDAVGGTASTDSVAVAATPGLDGLVIASPEDTHEELVHAAISQGTRIMCEKPLAVGVESCQRIVDAELSLGRRLLQLGLMRVFDPAHVQLAAEAAKLGDIHFVRCVHRNRHEQRRNAKLILNQSVVHDIHSLRWLTGREIGRVTTVVTPNPDRVEHLLLVAEFEGGGYGTVEFSEHAFAYEVTVEVDAELGGVKMAPVMRPTVRRDGGESVHIGTDWFARFEEAYRAEAALWIDSLGGPAAIGPSAWDGLVAERVVQAGLQSVHSGQPVGLSGLETPSLYRVR
ncbi:MAG TPA: Gfo/Idh/MocA family oxidoreductase [Ilumatobacteraceae bacterium]